MLPNIHVGMFVPWWKTRVYHNCCLGVIGPDGRPAFEFEEERGQSSAILTSVRDSGEKVDENLTILESMAEADVRAGRSSILFPDPELLVSNKACKKLLLSKLYEKNVLCVWWLTRLTVMLIGKFIIPQM